ncbi:MAG TPA: GtrA family protein [Ktedonobacteraceae bacterium]|nr:GtrA family protein [Ktedonobacteraceae bacterium]
MISLIKRLLNIRIVRYGMVGGVGILINEGALFVFEQLWGLAIPQTSNFLYPLSWFCAFEISNTANFTLNQLFTYREQVKDIHGWEWVRRAFKGQLTSISAMLISLAVAWTLHFAFHINDYTDSFIGMIAQFFYNFFISNKLVFRAVKSPSPADSADLSDAQRPTDDAEAALMPALPTVETSPK